MKVVKVYSKSCGPCRVLEDNLLLAGITHESIDIESPEGEEIVDKYNIRSLPTLLVFDNEGNEIKRRTGIMTVNTIKEFINA